MTDKIRFVISKKRIKWGWVRKAQAGDYTALGQAMAACMVDDNGNSIPSEQAMAILDDMDAEQMDQVMEDFRNSFRDWAVPPQNAAS